ncbi:MAG: primosomal protein DnaI [Bacilli bacterium]|nr:primosomal protein DnaI [Bacilli bacterium]
MKSIYELLNIDQGIIDRVNEIKQNIINNKTLLKYCKENQIKLRDEVIDASLMNLVLFVDYHGKCEGCQGLHECKQINNGYRPILRDQQTHIHLLYTPCEYQLAFEAQNEIAQNIRSFYLPKKILNASFDTLDIAEGRKEAIFKAATFAKTYQVGKFQKGLFLWGPFGVGKTYILAAMANALAKRHIKVALVYLPDMIRELRNALGHNNLEELLTEIKNVEVLILDDIGSEMHTQWVRDEIIGPLLQYRMLEEKPTFFTSNKTIDELIRDYAYTTDGVHDETKARRIGDRIKALAEEVKITGKNYRL